LQLFFISKISFRAVPRVLNIIGQYLGINKIPCTQTIINWVTRLSIARIKNVSQLTTDTLTNDRFSNGFICIIDVSIGLGIGKILTVLFLDANHHHHHKSPTLKDVHCVGVVVADTWNGETIADFLQEIIAVMGRPVAYLKDGGSDLRKAARLLDERGQASLTIDDISHVVANLLKHEYQNHPQYSTFITACGKVSTKLKQTILACLAPPKVSTKARFMNIHRLVRWADKLLAHASNKNVVQGTLLEKLHKSFDQLPLCAEFIQHFLRDANALLDCQKVLKEKGLSELTYEKCKQVILAVPKTSKISCGFISWLDEQLIVAKSLGLNAVGMPISSDSIESLFGVGKRQGTGEIKDANRIGLRIPTLCGELTKKDAEDVLRISVKEQEKVAGLLPSLVQQRRQVLSNPSTINELETNTRQNLKLIPESKNPSKNEEKAYIPICCKKSYAPENTLEKQVDFPLTGELILATSVRKGENQLLDP
jgi:hypothetical protein